jgi:hypothetical protein
MDVVIRSEMLVKALVFDLGTSMWATQSPSALIYRCRLCSKLNEDVQSRVLIQSGITIAVDPSDGGEILPE